MTITNQSSMDVLVNDVKVGEINCKDWDSLKQRARSNKRTYITQVVSFIMELAKQLMKDCVALPMAILAVISLFAIGSPQSFNSVVTTDPASAFRALWNYSIAVLLLSSFVKMLLLGGSTVFRNAFDEEAFRLLRLHVNCPATGTIELRKKQH